MKANQMRKFNKHQILQMKTQLITFRKRRLNKKLTLKIAHLPTFMYHTIFFNTFLQST